MKIFRTQCLLSALIFLCQVKHEDILQWSLHDTFISEINKIFCRQTIIWITRPRKFHSILPCCDYLLHCKLSCMRGQQGKFNHCLLKPRPLALNLFPSLCSHDKILNCLENMIWKYFENMQYFYNSAYFVVVCVILGAIRWEQRSVLELPAHSAVSADNRHHPLTSSPLCTVNVQLQWLNPRLTSGQGILSLRWEPGPGRGYLVNSVDKGGSDSVRLTPIIDERSTMVVGNITKRI